MLLRALIIFCFLVVACEEQALRNVSRPVEDGDDLPGYLNEKTASVKAGQPATISIDRTSLIIADDTTTEDVEVRLRVLEAAPQRASVASLGDAKGEVVEVAMYSKDTQEIYPSSILKQSYVVSQALSDVADDANLQYVVISAPGTDDEVIQTLSRRAITVSTALIDSELSVSIDLGATHVMIYAVESTSVAESVTILDTGADTSSDSGSTVSTSSSSTSSSSGGSSINCSEAGFDAASEAWVAVPANAEVGQTKDFCVMKYEAREDGSGNAVSIASGLPWVGISQLEAVTRCGSLGSDYQLISNEAWQTIARNIETAQSPPGTYLNWSAGETSGDNSINRGNSKGLAAQEAESNDGLGCAGITSNGNLSDDCSGAWHVNKRTHKLSNSEVIWDIAGNVSEWTTSILKNQGSNNYISQIPDSLRPIWGSEEVYASKDSIDYSGFGFGWLGYGGGTVNRGGSYAANGNSAGVFYADLSKAPGDTSSQEIGFRCIRISE